MSGTNTMLDVRNLAVALPAGSDRPYALQNLNFKVARGETLCLVGESGSGKSLSAGAILRLLPEPHVRVTAGSIHFDGRNLLDLPESEMRAIRGNQISMIFQEPMTALNPQKTVGWQIDEVLKLHTPLERKARKFRTVEMMEQVNIPNAASAYNAYPHQLSGGQRQRVMIAMALILSPKLIIADEPTTALDVTTEKQILKLIKDMQNTVGAGVLMITHNFGVVAEMADRVAVLCAGEQVEHGEVTDILRRPRHPYTRALIDAVPSLTPPPAKSFASAPVVLKVANLSKTFWPRGFFLANRRETIAAVKDVSFHLHEGETVGIVGESGSGKTTVSRMVTRLLEADRGSVELAGRDLVRLSTREMRLMRKEIQLIFQDPMASLNPRKTVLDLITQGPIAHGEAPKRARESALELLRQVELSPAASRRYPHEFPGGQRQRIGIARALAMRPRVIVADEPLSALDVSVQAQIMKLLTDLKKRLKLSLLFVTHDLRVAAQLCDRVIVMHRGEVVETGETGAVFANPTHPYTKTLLSSIPGKDLQAIRCAEAENVA
jgi:peptide/nickel transport system ATP-binding protein